jgi:hypothetical protein
MADFDFKAHGLDPDKFVTRRGIVALSIEVFGIPLSKSRLDKDAAAGVGPTADARVGQRALYRVRTAVPYILARLSEVKP